MTPAQTLARPERVSRARHIFRLVMIGMLSGAIYTVCEFIWRGHSHLSMFIIGGVCVILIGELNRHLPKRLSEIQRAIIGAFVITAIELPAGLVLNVQLGLHIWDYSEMPLNLFGQITPQYTAAWIPLAYVANFVYRKLSRI